MTTVSSRAQSPDPSEVEGRGLHSSGRILFIDHTAVLGGAQLSLLDIATGLRHRGATALFEAGPLGDALVAAGVAVIPIAAGASLRSIKKHSRLPSPSALVGTGRAVLELARVAPRFDLLYANSPKSFLVSAAAGLLARRPVVWHLRDILDYEHFSRSNVRLLVAVANARAARVVANSQATADAFVAVGGRRAIVRVVHNGIDAAPFDRLGAADRLRMRRELEIPEDAFLVGSFSRLHPWKGQDVLLDALAQLPDVHAIIVGGALFSGEAAYEAALRERASQPPLVPRVHLLGTRTDVPRLISACDLVVHTSVLPEPFGRVLVEALLATRPLVASDAGGVREIVTDGQTALLVPPGDAVRLADAVRAIRSDPAKSRLMAEAGAADVRRRFTREAMLDGVTRVIDDVLGGVHS